MDKKIDTGPVQSSKNVLLDNAPSLVTLVDDYLRNENRSLLVSHAASKSERVCRREGQGEARRRLPEHHSFFFVRNLTYMSLAV